MRTLALIAALSAAGVANATVVTQWNFNSNPPDGSGTTGSLVPNIGAGTASLFGGATGTFASGTVNGGSTDTAPADNTAWNTSTYAPQSTGSGERGVQFAVSTVGVTDGIFVTFDIRHSNTSSRFVQFQYTIDGSNWTSAGLTLDGAAFDGIFEGTAGDTWFNNRRVDLFDIPGVLDNADFAFRLTPVFGPAGGYVAASATGTYGPTGTLRYDMVTVQTPAPGAVALLGLGGLVMARRRR